MRTLRTIEALRCHLAEPRRSGARIGLVPTMGAFHEGHLSLMRTARHECDLVVVSLFVNPAQFNEASDLAAYPRDEQRDLALAEQVGVDYVFAPSVSEVYPPGFATTVSVAGLAEVLEGAHRGREHFHAVTTVVAKLFNIVGPDVAYFGQKDAQQALLIRRMAEDLAIPLRIRVCATVREHDGLAMSSRNVRLSPHDRVRAGALHRALQAAREALVSGEEQLGIARQRALDELKAAGIEPDYLEFVAPDTLAPVDRADRPVLVLVAARIGGVRLIDNELIEPLPAVPAGVRANGSPETAPMALSGSDNHHPRVA